MLSHWPIPTPLNLKYQYLFFYLADGTEKYRQVSRHIRPYQIFTQNYRNLLKPFLSFTKMDPPFCLSGTSRPLFHSLLFQEFWMTWMAKSCSAPQVQYSIKVQLPTFIVLFSSGCFHFGCWNLTQHNFSWIAHSLPPHKTDHCKVATDVWRICNREPQFPLDSCHHHRIHWAKNITIWILDPLGPKYHWGWHHSNWLDWLVLVGGAFLAWLSKRRGRLQIDGLSGLGLLRGMSTSDWVTWLSWPIVGVHLTKSSRNKTS
jgi:hypothetical protein